jgi:hypothetical protein
MRLPDSRALSKPILSLKIFDDDELAPMDPARDDHQQVCEERRHGTHGTSPPRAVVRLNGHYGVKIRCTQWVTFARTSTRRKQWSFYILAYGRWFGRPTDSQIASASLRSLLFVFTYGFTNGAPSDAPCAQSSKVSSPNGARSHTLPCRSSTVEDSQRST